MADSLFTKIINGEIPAHKIYEDELTLAFLDIHPIQPGHTLVIPKTETEFVWDLSDKDYAALMNASRKVALRLREVMNKPFIGSRIVGVDVPHAHVHLIPFSESRELDTEQRFDIEPDHASLSELAKILAF